MEYGGFRHLMPPTPITLCRCCHAFRCRYAAGFHTRQRQSPPLYARYACLPRMLCQADFSARPACCRYFRHADMLVNNVYVIIFTMPDYDDMPFISISACCLLHAFRQAAASSPPPPRHDALRLRHASRFRCCRFFRRRAFTPTLTMPICRADDFASVFAIRACC